MSVAFNSSCVAYIRKSSPRERIENSLECPSSLYGYHTNLSAVANIAIITIRQRDTKEQVIKALPACITGGFCMKESYFI
uniref:Uncharacterized protein n=1 Tax=Parascaris equorum TaxID=6256 RepID=A0A914RVG7_PAREQ